MKHFIFPFALILFLGCSRTVPWMTDSEAIERAHESVLKHLKSPATAAFSNDSVGLFDSTLAVRGDVDAQNEFGAILRHRFLVVFEPKTPHPVYMASVGKTYWGTYHDSLDQVERSRRAKLSPEYGGREWLKSGEFFPEAIRGRTKDDSIHAVEHLKNVLFDLDVANIDGELFDSTEVDSVHRARLRWKPAAAVNR